MENLIREINELAYKKKTEGLTDEEILRQKALREEYLKVFRRNMEKKLSNLRVLDENGQDITPKKIKNLQFTENLN